MRRTIYRQMVHLINTHRSWIVADGYGYDQCIIFKRGKPVYCLCRVLRLRSMFRLRGYAGGTIWSISEYELDRALAQYRKANPGFKERVKKGASYLTARDAEAIIEIATYGLLKLELFDLPLYK